jgi:hypothetical protein
MSCRQPIGESSCSCPSYLSTCYGPSKEKLGALPLKGDEVASFVVVGLGESEGVE